MTAAFERAAPRRQARRLHMPGSSPNSFSRRGYAVCLITGHSVRISDNDSLCRDIETTTVVPRFTGGPCRAADASPHRAASRSCEIEAQSQEGHLSLTRSGGDHDDTAYRQSTSRWRRRTGRAPPGGVWSPLLPVDLVPPSPMATARSTGRVRVDRLPAPRLPRGNKHVPRSGRPSAAR